MTGTMPITLKPNKRTTTMEKKEMDDYFVSILPMLRPIAKGIAYKQNKDIDADAAISEAYIHLSKNAGKIKTPKDLEKMVVHFIKMEITWTNSQLNKKETVSQHDDKAKTRGFWDSDTEGGVNADRFIAYEEADTTEDDLQGKVELEQWWDEKHVILAMYRDQEKDKVKQVIFDCYFTKKITKGIDLGKHLGLNKDYASKYIREMKQDVRDFYEAWKKNNNK